MKTSAFLPLIFMAMIGVLSVNVESSDSPAGIDPGIWTSVGDMAAIRRDHVATLLADGQVLVLGDFSTRAELYNPMLQTFAPTGTTQVGHGSNATATLLQDGQVLLVGGHNASQTAELYDPGTETFSLIDSTNAHRITHTATLLADGRVLIAGGQDRTGPAETHHFAEIYDPMMGTFTPTDTLIDDRSVHVAALLPNGEVLILGGIQTTIPGSGIWLDSAELYDPSGGTFRPAGNMLDNHSAPRGVLLQSGKVLIMGASGAAELYDPADSSFSPTDSLLILSSLPSVTVLQTGHVLVVGGLAGAPPSDGAQVYDPDADEFVIVASMNEARQQHVATLLSTGDVLVTGGYGGTSDLSTAEVYTPSTTVAVELLHLSISRMGGEASLRWEVSQSAASTVFHVYRQDPGTLRQRLTPEPLTGRTRYEFIDQDGPKGGAEYWLAEISRTGETAWHGPVVLSAVSASMNVVLNPPAPNPFSLATRITYSLPAPAQVSLTVFNLQGRKVATLVDKTQGEGEYTATWGGELERGTAPAGIYFVRLKVDGVARTQKLMFVR